MEHCLITSILDNNFYELNPGCFAVYGFEHKPGFEADNGYVPLIPARVLLLVSARPAHATLYSFAWYISWVNDSKTAWSMTAGGVAAEARVGIGPRPIPREPMVRFCRGLLHTVHFSNAPSIWWFCDS